MTSSLISVVVPCFNGANYIAETLKSILNQDQVKLEIIVVDDGSTDQSRSIIESFIDCRINYIYQKNQGVSVARNTGLKFIKGDYVVFFDADDIMTEDFLFSRLSFLARHISLDFVSGEVKKFNDKGLMQGYYRGTSLNVFQEVLLYNPEVITCPSNYLFRKQFLIDNKLRFNEKLSSTADKFFLVQSAKHGKTNFVASLAKLKYRVTPNSMSHKLTQSLVNDNEIYYEELVKFDLIPQNIRKKALLLGYFILFVSFWKVSYRVKALKYAILGFLINPIQFVRKCVIKK